MPTVIWIDEDGRIARPNDVSFGSNKLKAMTGIDSEQHLKRLRAWVRGEGPAMTPSEVRAHQELPTAEEQEARAEFTLAWWLSQEGHKDDAERHFVRAGELAPHDLTIGRGSMPIRGLNPMGFAFLKLALKSAFKRSPSTSTARSRTALTSLDGTAGATPLPANAPPSPSP